MSNRETLVIALGGNALLKRDDKGTFETQFANVVLACKGIADLIESGYQVVLTHGNGPQVGATLIRHDSARSLVPPYPIHACTAETQGSIGYMIEQALQNELDSRGMDKHAVSVATRVLVDANDPSFHNPTKPIGPYFERSQYPNLLNIFEGYRQGAKFANPKIKILGNYLGDWDDPAKGKDAALAQIFSGADFILHVADTSGHGVIEAAKEKGIYAFGAVQDQNRLAPDHVLSSFVVDIDKAFDHAVQMVVEDRFEGRIFKPGIESGKGGEGDGVVYLAPFHSLEDKVPANVNAELRKLTQEVIDRKIIVPEKFELSTDSFKKPGSGMIKRILKIALLTDALFSDSGWGTSAYTAAKLLETKYGHKVVCEDNVAIKDVDARLRKYGEDGYDLVIAHGFQWGDPAVRVGKDYPDTKFVVFTGLVSSDNVASIFPMQQEGTFLLGALAGMMTKTNIIGYVGGDKPDNFLIEGENKVTWKYQGNAKYRRVVPSPKPIAILERHVISSLAKLGYVVIACGGGGIPVVSNESSRKVGVDAVIDKDHAGELLARQIAADKFIILTDVEGLYLDFKKPTQRLVDRINVSGNAVDISQLEEGSMGPKVRACLQFVRNGGKEAIIASLEKLLEAVKGSAGTHFYP